MKDQNGLPSCVKYTSVSKYSCVCNSFELINRVGSNVTGSNTIVLPRFTLVSFTGKSKGPRIVL